MRSSYSSDATSSSTVGIKKGEVAAMQALLTDSELMKDKEKREKVFSRMLFFVAQGIDMSPCFPQMIVNASTKDYLEKKLIYEYLTYYAPIQSDLALLCVNTFRNDFRSESPQIRGLALRSLAQLRVKSLLEYIIPCITSGLVDPNSYVRAVAVVSALQIYYFSKETFDESKYLDTIFEMLRDPDPTVSGNCVLVLDEIIGNANTSVLTKRLIYYLLNRLGHFSEWHIIAVLNLVKKYKVTSEQEMYDIMNLLDKYLRCTNSGIVFSVAQIFLRLTESNQKLQREVTKRLVGPLLLMMSSNMHEVVYTAIKHALVIQERYPGSFNNHHSAFFWKAHDPVALRSLKLDMLVLVACDANQKAIITEMNEYVFDEECGAKAVLSLGAVGVRVPSCFDQLSSILQDILALGESTATRAVIIAVQNILRRYPEAYTHFIPLLGAHFYSFDSTEAKCALIYILGRFGEHIPASPYLLERFVLQVSPTGGEEDEDEGEREEGTKEENEDVVLASASSAFDSVASSNVLGSQTVRLQLSLLSALTRLFFLRPGEVQPILGRLLADVIGDAPQGVVRDRALFVYRMLRDNIPLAKEVFLDSPEKIKKEQNERALKAKETEKKLAGMDVAVAVSYAEDESNVVKEQVWHEWGTFSVIYGHTEGYFSIPLTRSLKLGKLVKDAQQGSTASSSSSSPPSSSSPSSATPAPSSSADVSQPLSSPLPPAQPKAGTFAVPNSPCTAPQFQQIWKTLQDSAVEQMPLTSPPSPQHWKQAMSAAGYTVVALGGKEPNLRMFVYTKTNMGADVCAMIQTQQDNLTCTVRSTDTAFATEFAMNLLSAFL